MRLGLAGGAIAILLLIAVIVGYSTFFTVNQTKQALVVRLGQPVRVITEPGLNVKVPFIDSVIYIDKRILDLESPSQEVIASDQKRLVVDAFARYRIMDPLKFYQTVGENGANSQLAILLNSALRSVLGGATLVDVVRNMREQLMSQVRQQLDHEAQQFGIQVVDVRIRRADLPEQNSQLPFTSACKPSGSVRQPNSAPKAAIRARIFAPRPTATCPCCLRTLHRSPSYFAVKVTAKETASLLTLTIAIPTSSPSIAPCRLTKKACSTAIRAWY